MSTWFDALFGVAKTPQQIAYEQARQLAGSIRDLDAASLRTKNSGFKNWLDAQNAAGKGNRELAETYATSFVKSQRALVHIAKMRVLLEENQRRLEEIQTTEALADCLKVMTRALKTANSRVKIQSIQKTIMEYEKAYMMQEMKQETLQGVSEDPSGDEEEEIKTAVSQLFDQQGLLVKDAMPGSKSDSIRFMDQGDSKIRNKSDQ